MEHQINSQRGFAHARLARQNHQTASRDQILAAVAEQRLRRLQPKGEELPERYRHLNPRPPRLLHQLERLPQPLSDLARLSTRERHLGKSFTECRELPLAVLGYKAGRPAGNPAHIARRGSKPEHRRLPACLLKPAAAFQLAEHSRDLRGLAPVNKPGSRLPTEPGGWPGRNTRQTTPPHVLAGQPPSPGQPHPQQRPAPPRPRCPPPPDPAEQPPPARPRETSVSSLTATAATPHTPTAKRPLKPTNHAAPQSANKPSSGTPPGPPPPTKPTHPRNPQNSSTNGKPHDHRPHEFLSQKRHETAPTLRSRGTAHAAETEPPAALSTRSRRLHRTASPRQPPAAAPPTTSLKPRRQPHGRRRSKPSCCAAALAAAPPAAPPPAANDQSRPRGGGHATAKSSTSTTQTRAARAGGTRSGNHKQPKSRLGREPPSRPRYPVPSSEPGYRASEEPWGQRRAGHPTRTHQGGPCSLSSDKVDNCLAELVWKLPGRGVVARNLDVAAPRACRVRAVRVLREGCRAHGVRNRIGSSSSPRRANASYSMTARGPHQ